ncbi:MAG: fructosamine kinase family protein [Alcanivoracaceae bacterium]
MHLGPRQLQHSLARAGLPAGELTPVSGGSLPAFRLSRGGQAWFIKVVPDADMAAAEADGLHALAKAPVQVPEVVHQSAMADGALLVLQWLTLRPVVAADEEAFGRCLAALHRLTGPHYGWHRDNWIGQGRQHNCPADDWAVFFRDQRLAPQLRRARAAGLPADVAGEVEWAMQRIHAWLDHAPAPVLVHGDLWSGNRAMAGHRPALFDPAVYYGDPLVDLAMLHLFGGPGAAFWPAYTALNPVDGKRFRRVQPLYDLYHWLNHFTIFGDSYLTPIQRCCAALRRELRG